jgi:8-oxo-dGTP pyrophosphatase MutT (NUDIX family)
VNSGPVNSGPVNGGPVNSGPDRAGLAAELDALLLRQPERAAVVARLRALLNAPGDGFSRRHLDPGHFTASAFVICPERRRLLMIRHPKLGRWLQPGGHIEASDPSCCAAAQREVQEETGVAELELLEPGIFDVDVHAIPANSKEGAHAHFDVRYAFAARSTRLRVSEVKAARWVELPEVAALNDEESIARCVRGLTSRLFSGLGPRY